eukprot:5051368-Amphidinium_carterae.1
MDETVAAGMLGSDVSSTLAWSSGSSSTGRRYCCRRCSDGQQMMEVQKDVMVQRVESARMTRSIEACHELMDCGPRNGGKEKERCEAERLQSVEKARWERWRKISGAPCTAGERHMKGWTREVVLGLSSGMLQERMQLNGV